MTAADDQTAQGAEETRARVFDFLHDAIVEARTDTSCRCEDDGTETDDWFDRSICPDPCGSMHTVCTECGRPKGRCAVREQNQRRRRRALTNAAAVLSDHRIDADGGCVRCQPNGPTAGAPSVAGPAPWPCPAAVTALYAVNPRALDEFADTPAEHLQQSLIFESVKRAHPQPDITDSLDRNV